MRWNFLNKFFKKSKEEVIQEGLGYCIYVADDHGITHVASLDEKMTAEQGREYVKAYCESMDYKLKGFHFEETRDGKYKMLNFLFDMHKKDMQVTN